MKPNRINEEGLACFVFLRMHAGVDIDQFRYAVEVTRSLFLRITSHVYSGPDGFTHRKSSAHLAIGKICYFEVKRRDAFTDSMTCLA